MSSSDGGPFEAVSESLARLAGAHGVATEYWDQSGRLVSVSAATVRAVLTALGVASGSEAEVGAELERAALRDWRRTLPPTFIGREGEDRRLPVHVPHGEKVVARIELEDGSRRQLDQMDWWVEPTRGHDKGGRGEGRRRLGDDRMPAEREVAGNREARLAGEHAIDEHRVDPPVHLVELPP